MWGGVHACVCMWGCVHVCGARVCVCGGMCVRVYRGVYVCRGKVHAVYVLCVGGVCRGSVHAVCVWEGGGVRVCGGVCTPSVVCEGVCACV